MEFSRQENWSGLPFPTPGDLPNPGIESALNSVVSCIVGRFFSVWATREVWWPSNIQTLLWNPLMPFACILYPDLQQGTGPRLLVLSFNSPPAWRIPLRWHSLIYYPHSHGAPVTLQDLWIKSTLFFCTSLCPFLWPSCKRIQMKTFSRVKKYFKMCFEVKRKKLVLG